MDVISQSVDRVFFRSSIFLFFFLSSTDIETLSLIENYTLVGVNFEKDFIHRTTGPRDILIIVDASGSIPKESLTVSKACRFLGVFMLWY